MFREGGVSCDLSPSENKQRSLSTAERKTESDSEWERLRPAPFAQAREALSDFLPISVPAARPRCGDCGDSIPCQGLRAALCELWLGPEVTTKSFLNEAVRSLGTESNRPSNGGPHSTDDLPPPPPLLFVRCEFQLRRTCAGNWRSFNRPFCCGGGIIFFGFVFQVVCRSCTLKVTILNPKLPNPPCSPRALVLEGWPPLPELTARCRRKKDRSERRRAGLGLVYVVTRDRWDLKVPVQGGFRKPSL